MSWRIRWVPGVAGAGVALAAALGLLACVGLPARGPAVPADPAQTERRVTVHTDRGPLPPAAERRALDRVRAEGLATLTDHHLRVLAGSGRVELVAGNATRLLVDGPATFAAMKAALARAREQVLIESYIVEDEGVAGEIAELLARKAREGVTVALLYDAVGSMRTDDAHFRALREAGVAVCKFNPINPLERPGYWGINHRNHRKVMVVDGEVGFAGGINISRVYASGSFSRRRAAAPDDLLDDGWRDTHIELRGPVVAALGRSLARTWASQGCEAVRQVTASVLDAPAKPAGTRVVTVLESDPAHPQDNRIYVALLRAIDAAQRSVHLTMAYFAPGPDMVAALADAARRGVDVQLVLPGRSDFALVLHAGRAYYRELLAAGVRIHEMEHALMHAKTAVIDGVFATVGSSNMDWRSFVDNSELNVVVLGEDFGRELEALFERDRAASRPITADDWERRGWRRRALEQVGRLVERLL